MCSNESACGTSDEAGCFSVLCAIAFDCRHGNVNVLSGFDVGVLIVAGLLEKEFWIPADAGMTARRKGRCFPICGNGRDAPYMDIGFAPLAVRTPH